MGAWKSAEMVRRYAHLAPAKMAQNQRRLMPCFTSQIRHGTILAWTKKRGYGIP
jgi:hypothetical protein